MLEEFHDCFGAAGANDPGVRPTLIKEETKEVLEALEEQDLEHLAQELADLAYVAYGTALVYGIDLDLALAEVHRSNMSKLGADGSPIIREDGKVLKGPNYFKPDLSAAVKSATVS